MTDTSAAELEPIVLAFSDGRRHTLEPELTRRIWKEVELERYSGPADLIHRALDALFQDHLPPGPVEAHSDKTSD